MMEDQMVDDTMMDEKMAGHEMSPKVQMDEGIQAKDIKCNAGLQLIMKSSDQSPACVKPDTASVLLQRGWATPMS